MAITASRSTLGMDREVARESAASRGRASLLRKGLRQAKKEKNYDKALEFSKRLEGEGKAYGMTGSTDDTSSIARGRVASREALANQMRAQIPAVTGQTREGNIAAAKAAGTFDATRERFNRANQGSQTMDESGNITKVQGSQGPSEYDLENRRQYQAESDQRTAEARRKFQNEGTVNYYQEEAAVEDYPVFNERKKPAQMEDWLASQRKTPVETTTPALVIKPQKTLSPGVLAEGDGARLVIKPPKPRAKGGPVKAGEPYLVGEEGPELMVPDEDGKVVSNKDLKKKSRKKLSKLLAKR